MREKLVLKEKLGIYRHLQYVTLEVSNVIGLTKKDLVNLCLKDDKGSLVEADFRLDEKNKLSASIITDLKAFEEKTYYLEKENKGKYSPSSFNSILEDEKQVQISNPSFSITFSKHKPIGKDKSSVLKIETRRSNNNNNVKDIPLIIEIEGGFKDLKEDYSFSWDLEDLNLSSLLNLKYDFNHLGSYIQKYQIFKNLDYILVEEECNLDNILIEEENLNKEEKELCFIFKTKGFEATSAYTRMHSPNQNLGPSNVWRRLESNIDNLVDPISLQPFYCWDLNCATLIQYINKDASLSLIPIKANSWENGIKARPIAKVDKKAINLELPLGKLKRAWLLDISSKEPFMEKTIDLKNKYQNWDEMLKDPIKKVFRADILAGIFLGPNLTQINKWEHDFKRKRTVKRRTSSYFIKRKDANSLRKRLDKNIWLKDTIRENKDNEVAYDPAGIYLLIQDEQYASITKDLVITWLKSRLELFFNFGYSLHELVAIRLSRPLRLIALDYDITKKSSCYTKEDKKFIESALALLTSILYSSNYWPSLEAGFSRGNRNFHSDRFSALGICACVLQDSFNFKPVISYVEEEIEKELNYCIKQSSAWIEAPNYQAYSMSYLIILFTLLKNTGYKNWFENKAFLSTLSFLTNIQTPFDYRYGAHMLPTLGDTASNYWSQSFSNIFAWAALSTKGSEFSKTMMSAWKKAGSPYISAGGELNSTFKMLALINDQLEDDESKMVSSSDVSKDRSRLYLYEGFGALIKDKESYLLLKSGDISMHYDHDENTFIWYQDKTPLLIDIGSQYAPACDASFMHNRIALDMKTDQARGNLIEVERNANHYILKTQTRINKVQEWPLWPPRESTWNFRYAKGPYDIDEHIWTRQIIYLLHFKSLLIKDEVKGSLPFTQNFVILTESYTKDEKMQALKYDFKGQDKLNISAFVINADTCEVLDWEHKGLEEDMFKKAFSQDYKDFKWMWHKAIEPMGERVQILRPYFSSNTSAITLLSAYEEDKRPKVEYDNNILSMEKEGKIVRINIDSMDVRYE